MNVPEVDLHKLTVSDPFLGQYQRLVRDVVIPYQWDALNDRIPEADPSHAIENFRIAAKRQSGEFYGMVFQDSDVAKWLEAVAWSLCQKPDPELEKTADDVIALVAAAQCADGYLNTYFTVKAPQERWNNLAECHELYCAGHMIEAGVAFFQATGKRRLLEVVCRLADHIDSVFGPGENQLHGYPGHPEIELALMRLYEITQQPRYMALADYFVEQRGTQPHYYDEEYAKRGKTAYWHTYGPAWMVKDKAYSQAHLPLSAQQTATGHAVRFVYLMAGVAHLARLSQDEDKRQTCLRLWNNMAQRQLYITGGIGSQSSGEAFSSDYDLPNDTVYAESCASIGLMMFARRMLEMEVDSRYADVMERALYNTVLGGMALDGKHFFYVNPLVRHTAGKVAVQRGPLIYCLEQADNGEALHNLWLPKESKFNAFEGKGLFANQMLIQAEGVRRGTTETPPQALWHFDAAPGTAQPHTLTFIPWFSWANRGEGEMRIWVNER
ncbi:glycoside hydrolase family 127 protein [Salmonella enterica]|nr:glycoside hydrolase family 127 protein [Salmonella enterica]